MSKTSRYHRAIWWLVHRDRYFVQKTERIQYKLLSLTQKLLQPPNVHISINSSLFNLLAALALHVLSPSLDHQRHPRYVLLIAPFSTSHLVSGRTSSLLQSVNLIPVSLSLTLLFTSSSSVDSPLSSSITPSHFHSRLKHTKYPNPSSVDSISRSTESTAYHPHCIFWAISVVVAVNSWRFLFLSPCRSLPAISFLSMSIHRIVL